MIGLWSIFASLFFPEFEIWAKRRKLAIIKSSPNHLEMVNVDLVFGSWTDFFSYRVSG